MIPFENFSQSNSLAYFKYEEKLHLYDPVISNMVSERYRCAIYSDYEDEEDESDFAYKSDEEELSDLKKMKEDSVSAGEEISNNDFIFVSFNQHSDLETVYVTSAISIKPEIQGYTMKIGEINCFLAPSFLNPEVKNEEIFQKIGIDENSDSEFLASDLFHHLCLEFGSLPSPTAASSPETIATPSRFSSFSFDPGGASKHAGYTTVCCSDFVLDPSFNTFILLSTDLIEKCVDLTFAKPIIVFDPGGNLAVDFASTQHLLHVATKDEGDLLFADLISPKLLEDLILVFNPGGRRIISVRSTTLSFESVHHLSLSSLSMDFAALKPNLRESENVVVSLFPEKQSGLSHREGKNNGFVLDLWRSCSLVLVVFMVAAISSFLC